MGRRHNKKAKKSAVLEKSGMKNKHLETKDDKNNTKVVLSEKSNDTNREKSDICKSEIKNQCPSNERISEISLVADLFSSGHTTDMNKSKEIHKCKSKKKNKYAPTSDILKLSVHGEDISSIPDVCSIKDYSEVSVPKYSSGATCKKSVNCKSDMKDLYAGTSLVGDLCNNIDKSRKIDKCKSVKGSKSTYLSNICGEMPKPERSDISGPEAYRNRNFDRFNEYDDEYGPLDSHNSSNLGNEDFLSSTISVVVPKPGCSIASVSGTCENGNKYFDDFNDYGDYDFSDNEYASYDFHNSSNLYDDEDVISSNIYALIPKPGCSITSDSGTCEKGNRYFDDFNDHGDYDFSDDEYAPYDFHSSSNLYEEDESTSVNKFDSRKDFPKRLNGVKVKANETIFSNMDEYEHCKHSFSRTFLKWLSERKKSLQKLQSLCEKVKNDQRVYYESQATIKDWSSKTRQVQLCPSNGITDFLGSVATFFLDASSGATSFAHACVTDHYQNEFEEIMNHDAEITKDLYEIRSQCITKYEGVEEVMRKFHSCTLNSTVKKISDDLELDKHWESIKKVSLNDGVPDFANVIGNLLEDAYQSEKPGKVQDLIKTYFDSNPSAQEFCKSACKTLYEATSLWLPNCARNKLIGLGKSAITYRLMEDDLQESHRLRSISSEHGPQSKLESQIEEAMQFLESEMREISDAYYQFEGKSDSELNIQVQDAVNLLQSHCNKICDSQLKGEV